MEKLSVEDVVSIHREIWPFIEDIAISVEAAAASAFKVVLESQLYVPIVCERLRRLGYHAHSGLDKVKFLKVGHPIPHTLRIEVRSVNA